ncbi:MAG TPA: hypothetical protein VH351_20405 [Bryobacteraceae bacterium]|jgi:anti-sigma28 factor (negative regulator of flagellin synthesis)|nr:hypothetical protein [Bryobacteraceae bacterium]
MKINDQGFTERLSPQTSHSGPVGSSENAGSAKQTGGSSPSDILQLSNLASRLQNSSSSDSARSARLSQIAQAVKTNTLQVNAAQISGAIVSEAIQPSAR